MKRRRKAVLELKKVPLLQIEYSQWMSRIIRAISAQIKYSKLEIDPSDSNLIINILTGSSEYFIDSNIEYINSIYDMSLPTWSETKEFIESQKII